MHCQPQTQLYQNHQCTEGLYGRSSHVMTALDSDSVASKIEKHECLKHKDKKYALKSIFYINEVIKQNEYLKLLEVCVPKLIV